MLRFLKGFFGKPTPPELKAPYKVEIPTQPASTVHVVETPTPVIETAPAEVGKPANDRVEATAPAKPASKPRAKPAAKPAANPAAKPITKPAAMKAPAKPKTPGKPKATK